MSSLNLITDLNSKNHFDAVKRHFEHSYGKINAELLPKFCFIPCGKLYLQYNLFSIKDYLLFN